MNCFNEGFSDEDNNAAALNQLPKVFLNYTKAHLDAIDPSPFEAAMLWSAGQASPEPQIAVIELPVAQDPDSPMKRRRHRSLDAGGDEVVEELKCRFEIDNAAEISNIQDIKQVSLQCDLIQEQTLTSNPRLFDQFKKVFKNSPSRNHFDNLKESKRSLRKAEVPSTTVKARSNLLGLQIQEYQVDESLISQSDINTTRSAYVMAPICMNTP